MAILMLRPINIPGCMRQINKIIIALLNNPLCMMRFVLPTLVAKVAFDQLTIIYFNGYTHVPGFSKTWFLQMLPETWLTFNPGSGLFFMMIILSAVGATFGLAGRLWLLILAVLEFYIGGVFETMGIFDHNSSLSSQVLLVLALVPGSMRISVDNYLQRRFFKPSSTTAREFPPKWGLSLILILLVLTYFTAGISKIRHGGIKWLDGETLGFYLENYVADYPGSEQQLLIANKAGETDHLWKDNLGFEAHTYGNYQYRKAFIKLGQWVAERPALVIAISVITIVFEFAWFVVFINSRYRNLYLIAAIITHTMIGVLMGLYFLHYRLICLFLLDWNLMLRTFGGSYCNRIASKVRGM